MVSELSFKELTRKACERLAPALGYLVGPQVGLAASVAIFATWMLARLKGVKTLGRALEDEEIALIDLSVRINGCRAKALRLKEELSRAEGLERELIEEAVKAYEAELQGLMEEFELHQLRILALRRVRDLGGVKAYVRLWKLLKMIEDGKEFEGEELKVLEELRRSWASRQLRIDFLRKVMDYA